MKIYLVGGAVRDAMLGDPVKDRDWVVVGSTPEELLSLGYQQVGKDFPVFIHPETGEQYALARKERKVGSGYYGFECQFGPEVTLEEDLLRRDLTINAMAQTLDGQLVDPYGGADDLKKRLLRHVSPAFVEDPVRVLRVARFAARLASKNFQVAAETQTLMTTMVKQGEIDALIPERVWQELHGALKAIKPSRFFEVLEACGALSRLYPDLMQELPRALTALDKATQSSDDPVVRLAALLHEHPDTIHQLKQQRVPHEFTDLAQCVCQYHRDYEKTLTLTPEALLKLLSQLDAWRRPQRFHQFLTTCQSIHGDKPAHRLEQAYQQTQAVDVQALIAQGHTGAALGDAIYQARLGLLLAP